MPQPEDIKYVSVAPQEVTVRADGSTETRALVGSNLESETEIREHVADIMQVEPEQVTLRRKEEQARRNGRTSVAFSGSRWRSPWDPKANPDVDPILN